MCGRHRSTLLDPLEREEGKPSHSTWLSIFELERCDHTTASPVAVVRASYGSLMYQPLLRAVDGGILRLLFYLRTLLPALRSPEMERFAGLGAEAAASQCCFQQPAGVFHW